MNIVTGTNVDLIAPFPPSEARRVFGWNFCYRTFNESDDVPTEQETFTKHIEGLLEVCPSWGIIDKNRLTNQKHEAPLVGIVLFEPAGPRHGFLHFASGRKAFKMGLVDEAVSEATRWLFTHIDSLLRVGMYVDERNTPVKWLARRLGYRYEGVCRDMCLRQGELRDVVYFGLPRREWLTLEQSVTPVLDVAAPSDEESPTTQPIPGEVTEPNEEGV